MTNRTKILMAAAALAMGCGSAASTENEPPRTTARAEAPRATAGDESMGRALADPRGSAPMAGAEVDALNALDAEPVAENVRDVNVYLSAATPVGLVPSEHASEFPVYVFIENQGDTPLMLEDVLARVAVERGGEIVCEDPGFGSIRLMEDGDAVIAPGTSHRLVTSLPCGLEEHGDYTIITEVLFREDEAIGVPAPTDAHRAASFFLDVSDFQPPYRYERPALAEVPPLDPARAQAHPPTDREL